MTSVHQMVLAAESIAAADVALRKTSSTSTDPATISLTLMHAATTAAALLRQAAARLTGPDVPKLNEVRDKLSASIVTAALALDGRDHPAAQTALTVGMAAAADKLGRLRVLRKIGTLA